jgi:hypothetical protein
MPGKSRIREFVRQFGGSLTSLKGAKRISRQDNKGKCGKDPGTVRAVAQAVAQAVEWVCVAGGAYNRYQFLRWAARFFLDAKLLKYAVVRQQE